MCVHVSACMSVCYFTLKFVYFMCMNVVPACMCLYHIHTQYPQRPEEDAGSPGDYRQV